MTEGSRINPPVHTPPSQPGTETPDHGGGEPGSDLSPRPSRPPRGLEVAAVWGQVQGQGTGGYRFYLGNVKHRDFEGRRELETESRGVKNLLDHVGAHDNRGANLREKEGMCKSRASSHTFCPGW